MGFLLSKQIRRILEITIAVVFVLAIGSGVQAATEPRNLYWGCQGSDVATLQTQLNTLDFNCGNVDGIFGAKTYAAVVDLQESNNLKVDGIVGPQTRQAIANLLSKPSPQTRNLYQGCTGNDVAELQKKLNSAGFNCGPADGIFGPRTNAAVVALQKACGITADGIVGPQTREALSKPIPAPKPETPSRGGSVPRYTKVLNMVATAYCPCNKCNYPYGGQPSYIGLPLGQGIVAVDPNVIPLRTKLYVEGYGEAIAADTGGAIKGNRIDLCFPDHQSALKFGIQNIKVYVLP
ncbi:MAG: peptidoglycan-binding protein [Syntrophomonadales bacterium]